MALSLAHSALLGFNTPAPRAVSKMVATSTGKTEFCYGLPGAIAPAGEFDPLGFSAKVDELEMNRLREAELAHGRVGMLASLGFLVQEGFHPLFTADGGPAIEQIPQLPPALWFGMTLAIGIAESLRIQAGFVNPYDGEMSVQNTELGAPNTAFPKEETTFQRLRPGYTPGDLGFDPLGLKPEDPAEFRIMQEKELSHGRLGMIAAAGFLAQEAVTGNTWGAEDSIFNNLIFGGWLATPGAIANLRVPQGELVSERQRRHGMLRRSGRGARD